MLLDLQVIRQQLQSCMAQRDQAAQTFQQCVGAIAVLEEQLKVLATQEMAKAQDALAEKKKEEDCGCKGESNGEVEQQEQVEAPKE